MERIEINRQRRGYKFFPENIDSIPSLYSTEETPLRDKVIHLHYFMGNCDWYIAEIDHQGTGLAFGYAVLHGDDMGAEWGYSSTVELESLCLSVTDFDAVVERDLDWEPKKFSDIKFPWMVEAQRMADANPLPMEFSDPPFINDKPHLTIVGEVED
jgi:hypothetical protein